ncbi:MBL fold metallo-hydrolase [Acidisoma cellulosilytica]|uniref:MBL fold metallo-hydrolase n=1 Tax=Acidisoma cellulosilyticum TaxID=2802395 RepID=A0A963Z5V4_9PROT|nr:MBL fold metallo-hydrolase [Acidisoma cellulosilyticum]MCB8883091.1 MBL fold metallo-hydrolase [Acidisoma cellulosilyticum]
MMFTRKIGAATVSNIIEYSAPTHIPDFLFPGLSESQIDANASWLAPDHWNTRVRRFIVTIQIWVVRAGANVVVIDTGVGNGKTRRAARMNGLNTLVPNWLEAAGASADEVTHVVHTHLHTDHVGWDTKLDDGTWVPTFPKAQYLYPKHDYLRMVEAQANGSLNPDPAAAYNDSIKPIFDAGLAALVEDDARDVAGCLDAEPLPGHTAGLLSYRLRSDGEEGIFAGDVMHNPLQIAIPALNTRFCEVPALGEGTHLKFLDRAAERGALIMPCHFGAPYCGRVGRDGDAFVFLPEQR